MKVYAFDIDGTICSDINRVYEKAEPINEMIEIINRLYEEGNSIKIFTARGASSGIDWTELTKKQLVEWKVKYHELIMNKKPSFDLLIDDKTIQPKKFIENLKRKRIGFVASSFDLIHPGYILMLQDAKTVCNYLVCGLQDDPTIDRPTKNKPILTLEERKTVLSAVKYVDEIVVYNTELELYNLLKQTNPDVRILGTDYIGKSFTGDDLGIHIHWHDRYHDWSTTNLKRRIQGVNLI